MRYEVGTNVGCRRTALVLGAKEGSGNIGDAIVQRLGQPAIFGYQCYGEDCAVGDGSRPPGGNLPDDETALRFGYNKTDKGRYQRFEVPSFDDFKRLDADALVVTLGATYKGHFADIPQHELDRILRANLIMPLEAARRYVQAASDEEKLRRIIFIGSYAHNHPFTNGTLYCAAKAGINMAAQTLAWELTDRNYRVHVVNPYHVQGTPMWEQVEKDVMSSKEMTYEEADAYNRKDLKMPDLLTADEVAGVVCQLVNHESFQWVTGPINLYGGSR